MPWSTPSARSDRARSPDRAFERKFLRELYASVTVTPVTEALFVPGYLDPLLAVPGVGAGWIGRLPGVEMAVERDDAMRRLRGPHERWIREQAGPDAEWWRPEQVHGAGVAEVPEEDVVEACDGLPVVPGVDGLISSQAGVVLSVVVADCGPVWLADRATGAVGLLHSGKKGTELGILESGVELMGERFGTEAGDLVAVLGPCIRPPHYDVDFAAEIGRQHVGVARATGTSRSGRRRHKPTLKRHTR